MIFLIDEDVDVEVGRFLSKRGHTVHYVVNVLMPGTKDPLLAHWADLRDAIIVTHNTKDFKVLVSRVPIDGRKIVRNAGRLSLRCRQSRAKSRVADLIDSIEFEFGQTQKRKDKQFIAEILDSRFNVIR